MVFISVSMTIQPARIMMRPRTTLPNIRFPAVYDSVSPCAVSIYHLHVLLGSQNAVANNVMLVRVFVANDVGKPLVIIFQPKDEGGHVPLVDALHELGYRDVVDEFPTLADCQLGDSVKLGVLFAPFVVRGAADANCPDCRSDDGCLR